MEEIRDKVSRIDTKVEVIGTNVKHLDDCLDGLKRELFGEDRQSGKLWRIEQQLKKLWVAVVVIILTIMGAGSGTISLKSLLEMLGK